MLTIVGKDIPRLDRLTHQEVVSILDYVFAVSKSIAVMDREHETFDFKLKYPPSNDFRIRKDFSSFANTKGGLMIIGVDNQGNIMGVNSAPSDTTMRQMLSAQDRIRPKPDYVPLPVNYYGSNLLVYQIFESPIPVEVYDGKRWWTFSRYGSTTKEMSPNDIMLKWYQGVEGVQDSLRLELDSVAFYAPDDRVLGKYVEWRTISQENLYRMLELTMLPAVFTPSPIDIAISSELYTTTRRWRGDFKCLKQGALLAFEKEIQSVGIGREYWSVTSDSPKSIVDPHTYRTGIDATTLQQSLGELVKRIGSVNFAWVILSGGPAIYVLGGTARETFVTLTIMIIVPFIPNSFPFFYLDEAARPVKAPLSVRTLRLMAIKEWSSYIPGALSLDEPPEEETLKAPPASIAGYLSPKPEPRRPDMPFRSRGLTVLTVEGNHRSDLKGLLSEMNPAFCDLSSLPMRLNDLREIRIVGHKVKTLLLPHFDFHDFHLILFNIECDVNQQKTLKLPRLEDMVTDSDADLQVDRF